MLNDQKENKEFLGKEEMRIAIASDEGIMPLSVDEKILYIPQRLAAKLSGATLNENYQPTSNYAGYDAAMKAITGSHANFTVPDNYHKKQQSRQCARYALMSAWSIYLNREVTTSEVKVDSNGYVFWGNTINGKYRVATPIRSDPSAAEFAYADIDANSILAIIDAQLHLNRPAMIEIRNKAGNDFHWAAVIGKDNSESTVGEKYTVIDPYDNTIKKLSTMQYYNNGDGDIVGCAILSTSLN